MTVAPEDQLLPADRDPAQCPMASSTEPGISISIVSHRHGHMLQGLISQIAHLAKETPIDVILTVNLRGETYEALDFHGLSHTVIRNARPLGFAENHNQAFARANGMYFCVLNPDIVFNSNPFPALIKLLESDISDVVGPRVLSPAGRVEDNARKVPTPWGAAMRLLYPKGRPEYAETTGTLFPDWIAGMFMLMRRATFARLGGFDERYHLYYEDADFCLRLQLLSGKIAVANDVSVVHDAQRASRKSLVHLRWHLVSAARFFASRVFLRACFGLPKRPRNTSSSGAAET